MWNDEIVEETRQVRGRYAVKFNYDLDAIYCDLKKQEEQIQTGLSLCHRNSLR
jgi:hypothetical protein